MIIIKRIPDGDHFIHPSFGGNLVTTFLAIAENSRLEFKSFTCRASGKLREWQT